MAKFSTYKREFEIPDHYPEGHVCTKNEADVLNQQRAEMLSHRVRARVDLAKGDEMPEDTFAKMREFVTEQDASFEFGAARTGSGEPRVIDPLEKIAREIARERVEAQVRKTGRKVGTKAKAEKGKPGEDGYRAAEPEQTGEGIVPYSVFAAEVARVMKLESTLASARKALAAKKPKGEDTEVAI